MSQTQRFLAAFLVLGCAVAGATVAYLVTERPGAKPDTEAVLLDTPRLVPEVELTDHHGEPWRPERLDGQWSLVFFGFTHCPDVCPETMTVMNRAHQQIRSTGDNRPPAVLFVSVDPARDTPERLAEYVPYFNPAFLGLTGEPAAIQDLARSMAVPVPAEIPESPPSEDYDVDHGASLSLVDPEGHIRAFFTPPHDPKRIARDYNAIVDYLGGK